MTYPYQTVGTGPGYYVRAHDSGKVQIRLEWWSPAAGDAIRAHRVTHVRIEPEWSEATPAALLLEPFADQVRDISSVASTLGDLSALAAFPHLEDLGLSSSAATVPFAALPSLRSFWLERSTNFGRLAEAPALRELTFSETKIKGVDVVSELSTLRSLRISQTAITSLKGLERSQIDTLDLQLNARLESIAGVAGLPLRKLELLGSRRVTDIEILATLPTLRELSLFQGPPLPSFDFVSAMSELRSLAVGSTAAISTYCSVAPIAQLSNLRSLRLALGDAPIQTLSEIEQLGALRELETLSLDRGPISSLAFLLPMRALRELYLTQSVILDGDLGPLIRQPPLEKLWLSPFRKHYSHTAAQLAAATGLAID